MTIATVMDMKVKHIQTEVQVDSLEVDDDNPRFFHLKLLHNRDTLTQDELLEEIGKDPETKFLIRSIKQEGVKVPLWVKPIKGGKYQVIEGNRRTYVLKKLCEQGETPPPGVRYDIVTVNRIDKKATAKEILKLKITIQTGKRTWRAFNESAATYELSRKHLMADEDIANVNMISVKEVQKRIADFELFQEYVTKMKCDDMEKFSFFRHMHSKVRNWVEENDANKQQYFKLISPDPKNGIQRLRSVSTKGGVRDFAQLLSEPQILSAFLQDKYMTIESALEILKEKDIWKKFDWLKRAQKLANQLSMLDEEDLLRIKSERKAVNTIKRLHNSSQRILKKLGKT